MAEADPTLKVPTIYPRPVAGWRREVTLVHPLFGSVFIPASSVSWSEAAAYQYTSYAYTPPMGAKQRALHSKGVKEITWTITGDLTKENSGILKLLKPEARGQAFTRIQIRQGSEGARFISLKPHSIPWESITFSGSPDSIVTFTLSGRSCEYWIDPIPTTYLEYDHPIPSWNTGNKSIKTWNVGHSVPLTPKWKNEKDFVLPDYYRPGESQWSFSITTAKGVYDHNQVYLSIYDGIVLMEGVVEGREYAMSGRNESMSYTSNLVNVKSFSKDVYQTGAVRIELPIIWPNVSPEGV